MDKGKGVIADVLVQWGLLSVGDPVVIGTSFGRVKAMTDHKVSGDSNVEFLISSLPLNICFLHFASFFCSVCDPVLCSSISMHVRLAICPTSIHFNSLLLT